MEEPPQAIESYLLAQFCQQRFPAWVRVDREGSVTESGGALSRYGMDSLRPGQALVRHAEFLHGLLPLEGRPVVLSCVTTETLGIVDVHLIPEPDGDWVLLLDASEIAEQRRALQQATNELAMLREASVKAEVSSDVEKGLKQSPILEELYPALGTLVLESGHCGAFRVLASLPEWFRAFSPSTRIGSQVRPAEHFPFLEVFLPDAEQAWLDGRICRSEVWTEVDPLGSECHLVATAVKFDNRKILLIARSESDFQEKQSILQSARDNRLRFDREIDVGKREQSRLTQAYRARSQFLSDMGHELRSPLSAILGFTELLEEQSAAEQDMKSVEQIQRIRFAGEHLLSVVDEVLAYSRAEAGMMRLHIDEFSVRKIAQDVLDISGSLIARNGNKAHLVCPDDPGLMRADLLKLRQSLLNLVSNAAKFTSNGSISLSIVRHRVEDREWVDFIVTDTGIGMTPDQAARLFEPYAQADSSIHRTYGGTGLGLAISRRYCRLMGGDILVQTKIGDGSTFTLRLPVNVSEAIS